VTVGLGRPAQAQVKKAMCSSWFRQGRGCRPRGQQSFPPTHRARHGEAAAQCAPHSPRGARLTEVQCCQCSGWLGGERWPGRGLYVKPHGVGPQSRAEQPCGNPRAPRSAPEALSSIAAPAGVRTAADARPPPAPGERGAAFEGRGWVPSAPGVPQPVLWAIC
jgi:hypothetical protein